MRLWKTTVRANVPSPFVWGLDLKVLLVPDMTLDFRLWHGISKEELAVLSIYWGTLHVFFFWILTFPEGTPWQERLCGTLARPVVEFTFNRATPVRGGIHLLVGQSWWNICNIWTLACELTKTRMFIHSFGSRHVCWVLCLIDVADPNTTFWVGSISQRRQTTRVG